MKPFRIFEGSQEPYTRFWRWANVDMESPSDPELEFYGYISEYSWFEDDITPKMFKDDLYKVGAGGPVTVRINSPGGDVIAAAVIKSTIMEYPGHVTVKIDGLAASAASTVAIAGDTVLINESAFFMIHDPLAVFFWAALNIEDLSRLLDSLKHTKEGILDGYQAKTQLERDRLASMMTDETWLTGREAVDLGFADGLIEKSPKKDSKKAPAVGIANALRLYKNIPAGLEALTMLTPRDIVLSSSRPNESEEIISEAGGVSAGLLERLRVEAYLNT